MDPILYKAIMEGQVDILRQHKDQLGFQLTANNGTVLHVAAQFHDNIECVEEILNLQPSLLCQVNSKCETAFHIAARNGHSNTVGVLIEHSKSLDQGDHESQVQINKEMIWMTNDHKDTALHEAVRNNHLEVVEMLVREDAVLPHVVNNFGETPLYIAAKKEYSHSHAIVSTILDVCISPAHSGPDGRTALHAAVIAGCPECTKKILEKKPGLMKEADLDGWTPLHYAAFLDNVPCALQLLNADKSTAYDKDEEKQTPLHIAAREGHIDIIKELLSHSPDCWEMVDAKGQNILHIAKEHKKEEVIYFIRSRSEENNNLEKQMDNNGNTPFNPSASSNEGSTSIIKGNRPKKENADVGHQLDRRTEAGGEEGSYDIIRETHLIVAALITTVTFTAGLTLPGGYDSDKGPDQGRAALARVAAFKAFVITNALAMAFSFCAIFVYVMLSLTKRPREYENQLFWGLSLIKFAMVAMMIAFMCGSHAVLSNSSDLALGVLVIGSIFAVVCIVISFRSTQDAYIIFLRWYRGILREIKWRATFTI